MARQLSDLIAWVVICIFLFAGGDFFLAGESLVLLKLICSLIAAYLAIGSFIIHLKFILPPDTELIKNGRIDLRWGFTVQYWAAWWPYYISRKQ